MMNAILAVACHLAVVDGESCLFGVSSTWSYTSGASHVGNLEGQITGDYWNIGVGESYRIQVHTTEPALWGWWVVGVTQ